MAATLTAPLFLGERFAPEADTADDSPPPPCAIERAPKLLGLTALSAELESGRLDVLEEAVLAPALRTRVALEILRRRAEKRGRAPLLRCTSRGLRSIAHASGWPTELATVAVPKPASHSVKTPATRELSVPPARPNMPAMPAVKGFAAMPVVAGITSLALIIVAVLYPNASISVVPATEIWQVEVPLTVDPTLKKPDLSNARLPGRSITKDASDTLTVPATGRKTVQDAKASGEVVLLNRSDRAVVVPKGTTVLAGAVKFTTQSDVTVAPSRSAGSAQSFGMVTVKVQAVSGGPSGNVERNKVDKVEGPLSASLSVQNGQPTRGGTERAATFVTEDDKRKLQEQLFRTLSERLTVLVKKELPASDKESLIAWSGQNPAIVESTFSKNADEEASNLSLTLKLRYGATAFANDAYNQLIRQLASTSATAAKPGFRVARDGVQPEPPALAGAENGTLRLIGRARATVIAEVDESKLRAAMAGKPVPAARAYLQGLPGVSSHDLHVVNFLPGKMPLIGWRIEVSARPGG
ncbi:MAG: baseplate J/gp47 family protein [Chloroflexota bacterium]